ncbi:hypothetical protein BH23ACT11_BH23ACT11_12980 [soil metagenome]
MNHMSDTRFSDGSDSDHSDLFRRAEQVLHQNDMGGWTKAAPDLYPHQWSWDSALIAIGLARMDVRRAIQEIETLFDHQWKTGKVPHIVFNEDAPRDSYFPGPDHWACAFDSPEAPPAPPYTSCLVQPPVHAIAARHIWDVSIEDGDSTNETVAFLERIYPKLLDWHRYLLTYRDREDSGLMTIYHPWESGTDNSPRWDAALGRVEPGEMPDFERKDLQHVDDPSERPTDFEYQRYIWLVQSVTKVGCVEEKIYQQQQFQVKDVLASSILIAANEALLEISNVVGASREDKEMIRAWISRGRAGLEGSWHEGLGLYLDRDVLTGELLEARTVAGFLSPLMAGNLEPGRLSAIVSRMKSADFLGHPDLYRPLPPSTSPEDPGFMRRSYWRGPFWPVVTWLLWWSLVRAGEVDLAGSLRHNALAQISEHGFGEYFDPFTGDSLGANDQSWTAAVTLEWLSDERCPEEKAS